MQQKNVKQLNFIPNAICLIKKDESPFKKAKYNNLAHSIIIIIPFIKY